MDIQNKLWIEADDKSLSLKELYSISNKAIEFNLKCIIESGTYKGLTAKRLSELLPEIQIISFEKSHKIWLRIPKENTAESIRFIHGKLSVAFVKKLAYDKNQIAIIIDGPKREKAISLAKKLYSHCAFIAIHDMTKYKKRLKKIFNNVEFVEVLAICR